MSEGKKEERAAGAILLWAGLHVLLCGLALANGPAAVLVLVLAAYALCVFRLDGLLCSGGGRELVCFLRNYWLAACVCMLLWMLWAEPKLAGSGGVMETLFLNLAVPYAVSLSRELGWACGVLSREAGRALQGGILLLCAGHAAYYLWLSRCARRKGAKDYGPVDPGAGTVE